MTGPMSQRELMPENGTATTEVAEDISAAEQALLSLITPEGQDNPFPAYAAMRRAAPVLPSALGGYFVTGYDACEQILTSDDFGVPDAAWYDANTPEWRDHPVKLHLYSTMIGHNPPDHTRLRKLVAHAFTFRRVESLRPFLTEITNRVLDDLADQAADGSVVELQAALGLAVPVAVMAELIGVPDSDLPMFSGWVRHAGVAFEIAPTPEELARGDVAMLAMREYFTSLVADRRRAPREDLASALVEVRAADGDHLAEHELVNTLVFLFAAGFETTAGLLGNSVVLLDRDPTQRRWLLADLPARIGPAVDELARFDGTVQQTRRIAVNPVEVGGVRMDAGSQLVAFFGAANRDPAKFPDPDRLDLARTGQRPLSYSLGIHYCLGAALARLELVTVLSLLYQRFPGLRLAGDPVRAPGLALRRYATMPVALAA